MNRTRMPRHRIQSWHCTAAPTEDSTGNDYLPRWMKGLLLLTIVLTCCLLLAAIVVMCGFVVSMINTN